MNKLLDGITVIEMGSYVAVPKATRLLADWGANVIKVEAPEGETWRHYGKAINFPHDDGNNVLFQTENMNKRCISLNMREPEAVEVLLKLLEKADVFITNTRVKSLVKYGLDYDALKDRFPKLIYASFTGSGEEGPEKDKPGYDVSAFWSRSSILYQWCLKENTPFKPVPGFGDSSTSGLLAAGVLAALFNRERTGKGEKVSASLLGTGMFFNSVGLLYGQYTAPDYYPESRYNLQTPAFPVYKTKDNEWVLFSVANWEAQYAKLFDALGLQEYIGDERYTTTLSMKANVEPCTRMIEEAIGNMTAAEVLSALGSKDMVCERLARPADVIKDEQAWINGFLREVDMRDGSKVVLPGSPIKFAENPVDRFDVAPLLGEDSSDILSELGYNESQISSLMENKVVKQVSWELHD